MKLLWIKWFPTDWLADGELSKTSLLGRGLWIEALNAMFNSDTYALSGTPDELSRLLRCDVAEFNTAFGDLQRHNAANVEVRNGVVTLISRRLERLQKRRENGRFRVSEHRKMKVCNTKSASASVSASDQKGVADRRRGGFEKPTFPEMELHASKIGLPPIEINKFFDYYESNGWRVGKNPMKSWPSAMQNWKRHYEENRYGSKSNRGSLGENPRNVGIVKGPTNYAEAFRRKANASQKAPVAGPSNRPESLPPTTGSS